MEDEITPFTLIVQPRAQEDLRDAIEWLATLSDEEAVNRFADTIDRELPALCWRVAESFATGFLLPRPDEGASRAFSRPVFIELIHTGRRRRSSSVGAWRVYYALSDEDGDNEPETLRVVTIRHAAAKPITRKAAREIEAQNNE